MSTLTFPDAVASSRLLRFLVAGRMIVRQLLVGNKQSLKRILLHEESELLEGNAPPPSPLPEQTSLFLGGGREPHSTPTARDSRLTNHGQYLVLYHLPIRRSTFLNLDRLSSKTFLASFGRGSESCSACPLGNTRYSFPLCVTW